MNTVDFNQVYDKIIETYDKGICTNGDEFIEYYRNVVDTNILLKYINSDFISHDYDERNTANYQQKYFAELFYNSIIDAYDNGLISNADDFLEYISNREDISNYYVMTLAVIADTIEDVYYDMSDVYESNKLDYALGYDLDFIGDIVGCPRPPATHSSIYVTFSVTSPSEVSIPIPMGTMVSSRKGTNFVTQEDVFIPIGSDSVDVYCESVGTGSGTRVLSNTINKIETNLDIPNGVKVFNKNSSSGGKDEFDDENYRELLRNWIKSNTKGSKEAYDIYFSNFDGLNSYKLIPNWNGSGTLKIVLDPGHPFQLQKAYDEIMGSVCQCPDDITMWSPTHVRLSVYATCNVNIDRVNPFSESEKEEIKSRIIDGIKLYINGDVLTSTGLGIGEDFVPYKLGVFLGTVIPELQNINFTLPSNLDTIVDGVRSCKGNEVIKITDEEIAFIDDDSITIVME